ncbi:MAG: alpha-2-macroglobulin [Planctomycetota bacterium]|nr:MAG: alpha-2-macroglobulin [Planctomycetota bacterium]
MKIKSISIITITILITLLALFADDSIDISDPNKAFQKAKTQESKRNYKNALQIYQKLLRKTKFSNANLAFDKAIYCYQRLNKMNDTDKFREEILKLNLDNPKMMMTIANSYSNARHYGYIVANKFYRGYHKGGGQYVEVSERDRVRALQIMNDASKILKDNSSFNGQFHLSYVRILQQNRSGQYGWVFQTLTDLTKLPDYPKTYRYRMFQTQNAPVDEDKNPILFHIPTSFDTAKNDGERWRFQLEQAKKQNNVLTNQVDYMFAEFLQSQWGVGTLGYNWTIKFDKNNETSHYALHTLKEDETLCKLATGVKRLKFPEGFNYVAALRKIAASKNNGWQNNAIQKLALIFENRRQFPKAAKEWKTSIERFGNTDFSKNRLNQIIKNWGRFESVKAQLADQPAIFQFRFRNADEVTFTAHKINMSILLNDLIAKFKANKKVDWQDRNINDFGYNLVNGNRDKYIQEKVSSWTEKLNPTTDHSDQIAELETPFKKAGAYFITAKIKNGNEASLVIFLSDTVIINKKINKNQLTFIGDAKTGKPLQNMNVEYFGYRSNYHNKRYHFKTIQFAEKSDQSGIVIPHKNDHKNNYQWLIIAKNDQGRFAYHGFQYYWNSSYYTQQYKQNKTFIITDRPVYKPGQKVYYKVWDRLAKYEEEDDVNLKGKSLHLKIQTPKYEELFTFTKTTDNFGGVNGEFTIPNDATLGSYRILVNNRYFITFRVEEYKKPEFEVKIETPKTTIKLGDTVKVKIKANYYFGAPVTEAKIKYKVLRQDHDFSWFPIRPWDWLYGSGYGWLSYNYEWYPGWHKWGCKRPFYWWWNRATPRPEVVMQNEVEIGSDGTVEIKIDTKLAKEIYGDKNHKYTIIAEVKDASRRTIVGQGNVIVTSRPFKIFTWLNKGYYKTNEVVTVNFKANTANNKPVQGKGKVTLYQIRYDKEMKPIEKKIESWKVNTDTQGKALLKIKTPKAGQFRIAFELKSKKGDKEEGGILFNVYGEDFKSNDFRFNDLELLVKKNEYKPGDKIKLRINTNAKDSTVLLFLRPESGVYKRPKIISIKGKSAQEEILVIKKDMPNFFIEAITISNCQIHSLTKEIIVPPEKKVLNVEILPNQKTYKPGQEATLEVKVTDINKNPYKGSLVLSVYDKALEYISGGSNVKKIKEFFWKWRKRHSQSTASNLNRVYRNHIKRKTTAMSNVGRFGHIIAPQEFKTLTKSLKGQRSRSPAKFAKAKNKKDSKMEMDEETAELSASDDGIRGDRNESRQKGKENLIVPVVRTKFADLAYWNANTNTDKNGIAKIKFKMPENLSTWKINTWAMGNKVEVGFGTSEIITTKDILIRLQAPRFFVEKDEIVLSAIVHNYLKKEQKIKVIFQQFGDCISDPEKATVWVTVPSKGEKRVNWRVNVTHPGQATIRMTAMNDKESDAMEMKFPVLVHGMMKMDSYSGVIRPDKSTGVININIPKERKPEDSELIVQYSPSLAGAMVDALPYLVEYPYGCTEQTLNRFLPTVITHKILKDMNLNLKDIQQKQSNLNAMELGNKNERAKGWKRWKINPVFDEKEVLRMTKAGLKKLYSMQNSDGGWGWFYHQSYGYSYTHTTTTVVHGLLIAKKNDVAVVSNSLQRGIQWLKTQQAKRITFINAKKHRRASNSDALVYKVLAEASYNNSAMKKLLFRDKSHISVYGLTLFGMGLALNQQNAELKEVLENIDQYLEQDNENQSAWLNLKAGGYWWYWYGNDIEANAYYLKLLSMTAPKSKKASGLVKYLLNNRKHATYWASTRDTALCIEAIAAYWKASGEMEPDMTVEVWMDGKMKKSVKINKDNMFNADYRFILKGEAVTSGKHKIEIKRKGKGSLYYNAYASYFTKEDFITKAGLEIKVKRKFYKLVKADNTHFKPGKEGAAIKVKSDELKRVLLKNYDTVKSGDLIEVELEIDSKNDYEYIAFEDPKASGFETVDVRSGYSNKSMHAYIEFKNTKVVMFVRKLNRGKHSISYKVRAEIPGKFSALPTIAYAMYAPELKGNSDENKINIED